MYYKINGGVINQQNYNCYSFDSLKTQQIDQIVYKKEARCALGYLWSTSSDTRHIKR